jgi:hypothetical protein
VSHLRAALAAAALAPLLVTVLVGPAQAAPTGPCTDPAGVTVVVDATALGGQVTVGCASAPATGTAALEEAGFTDARDSSGLICAIDAQPDPCPTTFSGQYWSYWYAQDGTWQAYAEGSDTAVPAPGGVEGWAWSDGSTPPGVDPAALTAGSGVTASTSPSAAPSTPATVSEGGDVRDVSPAPSVPVMAIVVGLIAVALVVATAVVARRRG